MGALPLLQRAALHVGVGGATLVVLAGVAYRCERGTVRELLELKRRKGEGGDGGGGGGSGAKED